MIYFITIFLLIILIRIYDLGGVSKGKKSYYVIILFILICTAGLRYRIGLDSMRYFYSFKEVPDLFNLEFNDLINSKTDPLYFLLTVFSKTISTNFVFFQFLHASILNFIVFWFIKRNTRFIFTGVLLYYVLAFVNFNNEVLRESLAVAVFLISIDFLLKKNWVKYYSLTAIAFFFHVSSFVLLFIPLVRRLKINKTIFLYIAGFFLISLILRNYFDSVLNLISMTDSISNKVERYQGGKLFEQVYNLNGILGLVIPNIFFPLAMLSFLKKKFQYQFSYEFLLIVNFFVCILAIQYGIFYRYLNYFILFNIILFSDFFGYLYSYFSLKFSRHFSLLVLPAFLSALLFFPIKGYFGPDQNATNVKLYSRYFPYSSIFEKERDQKRERLFNHYILY